MLLVGLGCVYLELCICIYFWRLVMPWLSSLWAQGVGEVYSVAFGPDSCSDLHCRECNYVIYSEVGKVACCGGVVDIWEPGEKRSEFEGFGRGGGHHHSRGAIDPYQTEVGEHANRIGRTAK